MAKKVEKVVKKIASKKIIKSKNKPVIKVIESKKESKVKDTNGIKYHNVGNMANVTLNKKVLTKKMTKEDMIILVSDITKFNKLKDKSTPVANKIKLKIEESLKSKELEKKKTIEDKKSEIKTNKKVLKRNLDINKERPISKPIINKEQVKEIKEEIELAKHLRYIGYKHPVTGKVWNGERYV